MFHWFDVAHGINYVSLHYFNAAGAILTGEIGEDHRPKTHLIPLVIQVPLGKRDHINIFGDDYQTSDGTCIRDYIHVMDLAQAHILAVQYLLNGGKSDVFNLGNGQGYSVKEIIEAAQKVTGTRFQRWSKNAARAIRRYWWPRMIRPSVRLAGRSNTQKWKT